MHTSIDVLRREHASVRMRHPHCGIDIIDELLFDNSLPIVVAIFETATERR
jgi:hypothetical protein